MNKGNVYLYLGEERLLIENKINRLVISNKIDENNITYYDLEEHSLADALRDALTPPFLCDRKAIIIKNPLFITSEEKLDDELKKQFSSYIEKPMETTIFIINACGLKPDERKAEVKKLLSGDFINHSKRLTDIEMQGWSRRQAALNGITFTDEAVKLFNQLVGTNLMNAKNELDKLCAYVGKDEVITAKVVKTVVIREIQDDVFALVNAVVAQRKAEAIKIYHDLIDIGNDANYLFYLIAKSMRELLVVNLMLQEGYRQAGIAKAMRVSHGRAFYMVKNARSLDYNLIKMYIDKLSDLDFKIKSGRTDTNTGLELFLFNI